jgi:drug/metabolite transporter (DMT)-like permease
MSWAIRHLPAAAISTAFLGEPLGAAILAWAFLRQVPLAATWIGGAVVLGGIALVLSRSDRRVSGSRAGAAKTSDLSP